LHNSVIKTVIRRAIRFGIQILKAKIGFFSSLVPTVVESLGEIFPELKEEMKSVQQIIFNEEILFSKTLQKGIKLFDEVSKNSKDGKLSGKDAFILYDTYGFPLELTVIMAEEKKLVVDRQGFKKEREIAM
jgi:alanyl-tRNA synthetase